MNNLWKKTTDDYESSAKVVDGNLIISLPDAINPVVWRMELGSVKASALEVRSQANDGTFMLALKTPKGDVYDIAPYYDRALAVHALMRVSAAMQGAHGQLGNNTAPSETSAKRATAEKSGSPYKWLIALAGVLIVIFLFAYAASQTPRIEGGSEGMSTTDQGSPSTAPAPESESGVPQSADQMLKGF